MGRTYSELKARQCAERDSYPQNLSLDHAEQESDPDSPFIFLWIAFNYYHATGNRRPRSPQRTGHLNPRQQNTQVMLSVAFSHMYTLRNQIMHGGAAWNGSLNRYQTRDCEAISAGLAPMVIEIMMDHPGALWGGASYLVIKQHSIDKM